MILVCIACFVRGAGRRQQRIDNHLACLMRGRSAPEQPVHVGRGPPDVMMMNGLLHEPRGLETSRVATKPLKITGTLRKTVCVLH